MNQKKTSISNGFKINSNLNVSDEERTQIEKECSQSNYGNEKFNMSYTSNSHFMSKNDISLSETFFKGFGHQENVYRSPFNDPSLPFHQISHNGTLSLDYSANVLPLKGRSESSAWLTEIHDATVQKGGEGPSTESYDQESNEKSSQNNLTSDQRDQSSRLSISPRVFHHRNNSNPFGFTNPLYSVCDVKANNMSLYSQPRTILSETTKETLKIRVNAALLRLKGWEETRVDKINNHRRICDNIYEAVKERIAVSKQGLKKIHKFFVERIKHCRHFAKMSENFTKLGTSFTNPNEDTSSWIFPKVLKECDDYHIKQIEKSKIIADFIESEILQRIIEIEDKRFKEKIEPLLQKFKKIRENLIKENEKAAQATAEYANLYKKSINLQKTDKDIFVAELFFLRQARIQTLAQKELGEFTVLLIKEIQKFEVSRLENLTIAMKIYVQTMNQLYGVENNNLVLGTLSHIDVTEETMKIYSLNRLMTNDDLELLSEVANIPVGKVSQEHLIAYLNDINFQNIPTNPLLIHECKASVEIKGQLLGTKMSSVSLTVDRNVVVYDLTPETLDHTIHKTIRFSHIVFKKTRDTSNTIEFIEMTNKFIGNNSKHVNITFSNNQEKQIFMDIYEKFSY